MSLPHAPGASATSLSVREAGSIDLAARLIREGGVVAFPTETVYGLGADASNVLAVGRVFFIKKRPLSNPLIVHIGEMDDLKRLAIGIPNAARKLARQFWPGPLTLVLRKRAIVPDLVTAGLPFVAIRMPRHPVARELLRLVGRPIAAPSANTFSQLSPTTADHVRRRLGDQVDMILDGGSCSCGLESTIVSFASRTPEILRLGALAVEELTDAVGPLTCAPETPLRVLAPGQMPRHYAPRTPLFFMVPSRPLFSAGLRVGLLAFKRPANPARWACVEVLSTRGRLAEAATGLYAALHRLDDAGLDAIVVEKAPDRGLGSAINDRLRRASWRTAESSDCGRSAENRETHA